jgi:hypothetical protein
LTRRLLPLVLLTALAACKVDVEGAPCEIAEHCPSGQGCGLDHRCSKRAATAGCALCTPGDFRCNGTAIQECSADEDPVCGGWVPPLAPIPQQCEGGLVCFEQSGSPPSCECPPPDRPAFAVAALGPASSGGPTPTGASEPPQCRFRTLTEAIGVASDAGGGTVTAMGGIPGQPPVVFSAATGETLPIDIPAGVTVTTDFSSSGAGYTIQLDDPHAIAAVTMHAGAALARFVVENVAGDSTRDAIALACDGTNPSVSVRLDSVTLRGEGPDAEHQLKRGIHLNDTCGVIGTDVVVTGMQAEALQIETSDPTVESSFLRGAFERSGKGIHLKKGVLKLDGVRVEANEGIGIEAGSQSEETALELNAVKVLRNGDTGIAAMNNTRLFVVGSTVFGNGIGELPTVWGPPLYPNSIGASRKGGGIVLIGEPPAAGPAFRFERNRVYSNRGDQLLVMLSSGKTWPLGASSCAATSTDVTAFGCYDATESVSPAYRGVVAIDAIAEAGAAAWRTGTALPTGTTDYKGVGTGSVLVPSFCVLPADLDCSSPDPQ